jgi:O-antigen/teichoic acid export membrane protein
MSVAKTIAKNTSFEFTSNIFELGIRFVVGIALTRGLGSEQYGLYAYVLWMLGFIALGTNLGLGEMSRRFIPEAIGRQDNREVSGFVQLSFSFRIIAAIIMCAIILATSSQWASASGNEGNRMVFIITAFYIIPYTLQQAIVGVFRGFQRFDYSFYVQIVIGPLRFVLILVAMALGYGILTVLIINLITQVMGILIGVFLLRNLVSLRSIFSRSLLSSDRKKQALRYALIVLGVLGLGYLLSSETEVFFIGIYHTVEDVGFFKLAFTIGPLIMTFTAALGYVLLPAMAEQFGKGDMEKLKRIYITATRYLTMISIPMAVGVIALAGSIITQIYGVEYTPVILPLQIICLPIAVARLAEPADSVIRGINRPGYILITNLIIVVINIVLSLLLVPNHGLLGAAIAISISLIIGLPVRVIIVNRKIGASWPKQDTLKIAIASIIMGTAVYFLNRQFGDSLLSLILGIPLGATIYFIMIFLFRIIREDDLKLFRNLLSNLPSFLSRFMLPLVNWLERRITKNTSHVDK